MASKRSANDSGPKSTLPPLDPTDSSAWPLLLIFDPKKVSLYYAKPSEELYNSTFAHPMPRWHNRAEIYKHPESRYGLIAKFNFDGMMCKRDNWYRKMHYKEIEFRVKEQRNAVVDEVMDERIKNGENKRYC